MKPGWMPLRGMKLKVKLTAGVERSGRTESEFGGWEGSTVKLER